MKHVENCSLFYGHPLMTHIFELDVPTPQEIIKNQNVIQHLEKEQHQKKFKIENTSPPSVQHSSMEYYYIMPSIQQLNLAKTGTKPTPTSLSTKSTLKQASTPGRLSSINPTPYTSNPGQPFIGEIKIPGGKIYYQKQIIIIFFEAKFINMYPIGMLFDASDSQSWTAQSYME